MNLNQFLSSYLSYSIVKRVIIQVFLAWSLGIAIAVYVYWKRIIAFIKRNDDGDTQLHKSSENDDQMFEKHTDG